MADIMAPYPPLSTRNMLGTLDGARTTVRTMTTPTTPTETLQAFLDSLKPGDLVTGTVTGFEGQSVLVDLDGVPDAGRVVGIVAGDLVSWRPRADSTEIFEVGQRIEAEVYGADRADGRVPLSIRAREDRILRAFLTGHRPGDIVSGTVTGIHNFGVFVALDGEPVPLVTGYSGTGFIRIPELSWTRISAPTDVVAIGQRVTGEVLGLDADRGEVFVSLKGLQPDPFIPLADRVGEVVVGTVTKLIPFGVFVRIADGIEGLVHVSDLIDGQFDLPATGIVDGSGELTVVITEVDLDRHQVRLRQAAAA